ncbi:MAG: cytochrome c biogenesis protein CcdA [Nitrospiraceae bacterium]|jgi:cytochrome c-type biogenesis protein|nr:cytochrome c biogenesis protein CcdA [Nitrospiraceae bacterium]
MSDVSIPLAFLAGVLSFLSPCVLPLVPAYVSLITGLSVNELRERKHSREALAKTAAFIAGFSVIFLALGASSSLIGRLFLEYQDALRIAGGIMIIVFGLFVAGIFRIDLLMRDRRFEASSRTGVIGAFLFGITFSAGWTPCIGPILGTILVYAGSHGSASYGMLLLAVYSLGLAVPFVLATLALNLFFSYTRSLQKFMRVIMIGSGTVLIIFGILLLTNSIGVVAGYFPDFGIKL